MGVFDNIKIGRRVFNRKLASDVFDGNMEKGEESFTLFDNAKFFKGLGVTKDGEQTTMQKVLSELRKDTQKREERYKEYKKALKDPIIGQAVEMMADDATQFDVDRERTVWVTSKDKKYERAVNATIEKYIEPFIDSVASSVVSKGEFVFKVIPKDDSIEKTGYKEIALLPYKKIERVHHLILEDQQEFYFIVDDIKSVQGLKDFSKDIKDQWEFVHFINYSIENSEEIVIEFKKQGEQKPTKTEVFVLQGESIITEKVLETYRILQALENGMIATRMAKSKVVRFVNVDVSRLTDDEKAANIINYIHSAIVENERIDTDSYESTTIQAEPAIVTMPVKNGVGKITVEEFTSDANVRDIEDVNYFQNKLFAGLRTPKEYFNFGEALPGVGQSGASLTRIDIRYSKAVKKTQRTLVEGVRNMIEVFNHYNEIEEPPPYSIDIVKVASAEDEERYLSDQEGMNTASIVVESVLNPETGEVNVKKAEMYSKYFKEVRDNEVMAHYFDDLAKKKAVVSKPAGLVVKGQKPEEQQAQQTQPEATSQNT